MVSNFIIDPLQSVDLLPVTEDLPAHVMELIERKRKRKRQPVQQERKLISNWSNAVSGTCDPQDFRKFPE